jgi:hypothetical protein
MTTEFSGPFTSSSIATEYQWSRLARAWGLDGVLADDVAGTDLKVTGSGTSTVTVAAGEAFVNGFYYSLTGGSLAVNVTSNATGGTARVDRVVLRLDPTADAIHPVYKTGGTSAPALTQDPAGIWEVPLAQCTIAAGASVVTGVNVVDQRWLTGKPVVQGIAGQRRPSRKGLLLVEGNDIYMGDGSAWNYVGTAGDPAWQAYTPVWDSSGTTINWGAGAVNLGRYKLIGKTCFFTAQITVGSIATWPAGAVTGVTLPFAAQLSRRQLMHANYHAAPLLSFYDGWGEVAGGASHVNVVFPRDDGTRLSAYWQVASTPVKAASGDVVTVQGTYETAN